MLENLEVQSSSTQICKCIYCKRKIDKPEQRVTFDAPRWNGMPSKVHAHPACARDRITSIYLNHRNIMRQLGWLLL
jgi:hypothetical protein